MSQKYLAQLRGNSAYPVYRGLVGILTIFGYAAAALVLVLGLLSLQGLQTMLAIPAAALVAVAVRLLRELSLMAADMADATVDTAATQADIKDRTLGRPNLDW